MLDLLLIASVGFLGSFGHCLGMCSPLTVAFSLSHHNRSKWQQVRFNVLLNLGRILSYAIVGAAIGALGSVLIAGGQLAGIDSGLRRTLAIVTGLLLIWFGLSNINASWLPRVPILHPIQGKLHDRFSAWMAELSRSHHWGTPALLGMIWGLIPCGFLYTAQIKAAETGNTAHGAITMLAFGLGTAPMMISTGLFASALSRDRRSQLFKLGGWVTLTIGLLTLLRSSDMVDYTGHAALICLMLALIARPISRIWASPLRYRRALGVGAFVLSVAHIGHYLDHTFNWNLGAIVFLLPAQQFGMWAGISAFGLMIPAALTSFDQAVSKLGTVWRKIHLFSIPALILAAIHTSFSGSNYLGEISVDFNNRFRVGILIFLVISVLLVRSRFFWSLLSLEKLYVPAKK
ncbi:urease accessory protein UreH domain-containing protein [Leptolyngbya sp. NIES-2104]|uniref:urease accessory protein UreH domain-containing protein n=1 Tax=Leptolyngbya sp. NIES-2104 TaxID=1552121 RepID=UPI0006ECBD7A|nr:sulfite exporter TauE/SafE family protein [Leptolyngbya sp. NIES-2104]GAP97849.1 membrane protein, putative [Leptolyngbya sp. NIES-2104]